MQAPQRSAAGGRETLREARREYFIRNRFGDDGGYASKWAEFALGPIPIPFPNTRERVRALRFHDLHHVLTGYGTDVAGESQISAWELGSHCRDMAAAWVLNLGGLGLGLAVAPRVCWRAFVRGQSSQNLYTRPFDDALLDTPVEEARRALGLAPEQDHAATLRTRALFVLACLAGTLIAVAGLAVFLPLALLAAVPLNLAARKRTQQT
ncbi:MAG: hypothetical protein JST92_09235 [Deltaproteobacteria bacterium]|nr:hypothetical protein [Deltaproteobacteria bacterium]